MDEWPDATVPSFARVCAVAAATNLLRAAKAALRRKARPSAALTQTSPRTGLERAF
jgi:hypothetical protein